jgi:hypothetical protein
VSICLSFTPMEIHRLYGFPGTRLSGTRVVFDPTYPSVDMGAFIQTDWKSMYGDVKEMVPPDAHVPRRKEVDLRLFVDSDHAGEQFTRRSRTGYVIYLNMVPIVWFSNVNPSGKTGTQIPQLPLGDNSSPWGDNAVCT